MSSNIYPITEICIDSVEAVVAARHAGAQRVELCSALLEGGLTPSFGMAARAMAVADAAGAINVKVHVMIRPRGGDFLYTDEEFASMKEDIAAFKQIGVHGYVFGILDRHGNIDIPRNRELIEHCQPASVTFHRAFDMARDPLAALEDLVKLRADRLLTSGQAPTVLEGAPLIRQLISQSDGRLIIMPGGDISSYNVSRIVSETGANEIHFAAFEHLPGQMQYRNTRVFMGGTLRPQEYDRTVTTVSAITDVLNTLRG